MITDRITTFKQIPFSLEMVKKIQAGDVKGIIKTRDGRDARFLGEINAPIYSLIFAIKENNCEDEFLNACTTTGRSGTSCHIYYRYDIILEIENEQNKPEYQFKPFDKVLARDRDNDTWCADFFSHYREDILFKYICVGNPYRQCIQYKGNEHLLGTTNKPKEE